MTGTGRADLVIKDGLVADGSGGPLFEADIAVDDGRIVAIGKDLRGESRLDAAGAVVAPGFIDIHTHYDPQVTWDPWLAPSSTLGVTSVVGGNCGYSVAPCRPELRDLLMRTLEATEDMSLATLRAGMTWDFESFREFLASIARRGLGINYGGYVGHTAVRIWVMGDDAYEREATAAEIQQMRVAVIAALDQGALGFSTNRAGVLRGDGGRPIPSVLATEEEVRTLCLAVAEANRGVVSIAAGNNPGFVYDLAEQLQRTITWNSILVFPAGDKRMMAWEDKLACHLDGITRTPDVHPQVTCRVLTFAFTMLNPLLFYAYPSFAELPRDDRAVRTERFRDPEWRRRARAEVDAKVHPWEQMSVTRTRKPELCDRGILDIAGERGCHPLDAMVDLALDDDLDTEFTAIGANADPVAVGTLLRSEGCVLGLSDAGAHVTQICDAVLPLDFLATWVRDRNVMSLEAGVRKLTGEPADVMGFSNRGYLRPGAQADIVVLDLERLAVGPVRRRSDLPAGGERLVAPEPEGLRHVLVNGEPTRLDGQPVPGAKLAGMILEPKRYGGS